MRSELYIERLLWYSGRAIDFHGLQVHEVDDYMNRIISYVRKTGKRYRIVVITGSGNHSYFIFKEMNYYI